MYSSYTPTCILNTEYERRIPVPILMLGISCVVAVTAYLFCTIRSSYKKNVSGLDTFAQCSRYLYCQVHSPILACVRPTQSQSSSIMTVSFPEHHKCDQNFPLRVLTGLAILVHIQLVLYIVFCLLPVDPEKHLIRHSVLYQRTFETFHSSHNLEGSRS